MDVEFIQLGRKTGISGMDRKSEKYRETKLGLDLIELEYEKDIKVDGCSDCG